MHVRLLAISALLPALLPLVRTLSAIDSFD
jgi:hypothetical protein